MIVLYVTINQAFSLKSIVQIIRLYFERKKNYFQKVQKMSFYKTKKKILEIFIER